MGGEGGMCGKKRQSGKVFYKMGNLSGGAGTVLENRQSALPLL